MALTGHADDTQLMSAFGGKADMMKTRAMSALGQKQTLSVISAMSALPPKTAIV
jgi:hypothetical protein